MNAKTVPIEATIATPHQVRSWARVWLKVATEYARKSVPSSSTAGVESRGLLYG